jgi:hypothetical protein
LQHQKKIKKKNGKEFDKGDTLYQNQRIAEMIRELKSKRINWEIIGLKIEWI